MKRPYFVLVPFLVVFAFSTYGQDYAFKVLANKGNNEVKSGDSWGPLKTGVALKLGDEIRVASNAYLGLVHNSGKPLELKEPKVYNIVELNNNIKAGPSVVTKYTDFILSSNTPEAKKNKLSATGAVDRGEKTDINIILPANQHSAIFNKNALISWEGTQAPGPYKLTIRNMFDDEIASYETPETSFEIDLSDPTIAKETAIIIEVSSNSDKTAKSKTHLIKRLSTADQQNVKKSLDQIMVEVSEPTALNKIILAGFYEENKLLIDAITAYEEAIKLAPGVTAYEEAFDEFLYRHDIKKIE